MCAICGNIFLHKVAKHNAKISDLANTRTIKSNKFLTLLMVLKKLPANTDTL